MGSEVPKEKQGNNDPSLVLNQVNEMKERITRMESFIKQAAALAAIETRRVEEIKEGFVAAMAALDAQLREKEEMLQKKDTDLKGLEGGLTAKIHDLESRLAEKEKLVEARDAELKDLKSKREAEVAALDAQLKEKEGIIQKKDAELKDMEQSLTAEMRDLEERVKKLLEK